jgi:hypothetical protein
VGPSSHKRRWVPIHTEQETGCVPVHTEQETGCVPVHTEQETGCVPVHTEQETGCVPEVVLTLSEENKSAGFIKTFFTVRMPYGCTAHM